MRHELADAIRTVHRGGQALPAAVAHRLATYTASVALTPRELEVLRLLAKGMRNRDIAETIGRTETTVKVHLLHVFQKLQVEDRTEAVVVARRRGIVHLD